MSNEERENQKRILFQLVNHLHLCFEMKIPYGLTTRYLGLLCSGRELVLGAKLQLALVLVLSNRLLVLATSTSHHIFDRCLQFFGKMLGAALQCLRKGAVASGYLLLAFATGQCLVWEPGSRLDRSGNWGFLA